MRFLFTIHTLRAISTSSIISQLTPSMSPSDGADCWILDREVSIGRARSVGLSFSDPFMSRLHCRIVKKNRRYELHDCQSTPGTRVNGYLIDSVVLRPGDEILLGSTKLKFECGYSIFAPCAKAARFVRGVCRQLGRQKTETAWQQQNMGNPGSNSCPTQRSTHQRINEH